LGYFTNLHEISKELNSLLMQPYKLHKPCKLEGSYAQCIQLSIAVRDHVLDTQVCIVITTKHSVHVYFDNTARFSKLLSSLLGLSS
jgi:hypothetical protein